MNNNPSMGKKNNQKQKLAGKLRLWREHIDRGVYTSKQWY